MSKKRRTKDDIQKLVKSPELQEMIRKDAEFMVKHAKQLLKQPSKSFKRKHALGAVKDLLESGLLTPADLVKFLVRTKRLSCPYVKGRSLPPCCKLTRKGERR